MQEIKLRKDYGNNQTNELWNGKFLTEDAYEQVISATEDTVIYKPGASLYDDVPLAYVVCDAYPDTKVVDCLKTIEETTTMRANASGPIDEKEMKEIAGIKFVKGDFLDEKLKLAIIEHFNSNIDVILSAFREFSLLLLNP